jgi:hypothetical protein
MDVDFIVNTTKKIVVIGWLPIDFFELEDMIIFNEDYFESIIFC